MPIILGVDPGSQITGYGLLNTSQTYPSYINHGILKAPGKTSFSQRLLYISQGVQQILLQYKPDVVVVEKIFLGKNADSAFKLGHARGAILTQCAAQNIPIVEYAARLVKKGITGNGAASKDQVRLLVQNMLKIPSIKEIDAADALSLALFHSQRIDVQDKLAKVVDSVQL